MNADREKLEDALYKRALGYSTTEENEEYSLIDGSLTLVKRKITVKEVPPELKAIEMLLSSSGDEYSSFSEADLEKEKMRLIRLLAGMDKMTPEPAKKRQKNQPEKICVGSAGSSQKEEK